MTASNDVSESETDAGAVYKCIKTVKQIQNMKQICKQEQAVSQAISKQQV